MEGVRSLERNLSEDAFTRAFMAALSLHGIRFLSTIEDVHQIAFDRVVKHVEALRAAGDRAASTFPTWVPGPITGRYDELDTSLLALQERGIARPIGPHFEVIELELSPERAQTILDGYTPEQQVLLQELSDIFTTPAEAQT